MISNGLGLLAGVSLFLMLFVVFGRMTESVLITGGLNGAISLFFGVCVNVVLDKFLKVDEKSDV